MHGNRLPSFAAVAGDTNELEVGTEDAEVAAEAEAELDAKAVVE